MSKNEYPIKFANEYGAEVVFNYDSEKNIESNALWVADRSKSAVYTSWDEHDDNCS